MILPRDESVSTGSSTTTGSVSVETPRAGPEMKFVDPSSQVNWGIWTLFVGATAFLTLRIWSKMHRRHGLWWDDHILISSWVRRNNIPAAPVCPALTADHYARWCCWRPTSS